MTTSYTGLRSRIQRVYQVVASKTTDTNQKPCLLAQIPLADVFEADRLAYHCSEATPTSTYFYLPFDLPIFARKPVPRTLNSYLAYMNDPSLTVTLYPSTTLATIAATLKGKLHCPPLPDELTYGTYNCCPLPVHLASQLHPLSYSIEGEDGKWWVLFKVQTRTARLLPYRELAILLSTCYTLLDRDEQRMIDKKWEKSGRSTDLSRLVKMLQLQQPREEDDE